MNAHCLYCNHVVRKSTPYAVTNGQRAYHLACKGVTAARGITVKAAIGSQCPAVLEESASSRTQRTPAAKGSTPFAPALSPNVRNLTEEVNAPAV